MKWVKIGLCFFITLVSLMAFVSDKDEWGFFAHRRINRLAVFTLPADLVGFYKKHIEYVTAHATDPDMRRYVVPIEGQKHFIDLDHWVKATLPRRFNEVRRRYAEVFIVNSTNDTLRTFGQKVTFPNDWNVIIKGDNLPTFFDKDSIVLLAEDYQQFFHDHIYESQYFEKWKVNCDSVTAFFNFHGFALDCQDAFVIDTFVQHGVLPYNLIRMQESLMYAMLEENLDKILRISADLGHYIADAHVPLHTHSNYNGQQTDQLGIHAFWETRLPEMFADTDYDFFVGQAHYIQDVEAHYWNIVYESHRLVKTVLGLEKELSQNYPKDQQLCFVERGEGYVQKMACEEYAKLYHEQLNGQVEQRFRAAIKAVGDAWFTAWVDAGQPDLIALFDNRDKAQLEEEVKALENATLSKIILGREH